MPRIHVVRVAVVAAAVMTAVGLAGCTTQPPAGQQPVGPQPAGQQAAAQQLRVQVLATLPHDTTMYTQGLEIHDEVLYEGSGQVGQSRIRTTALPGTAVLREEALPAPLFGEGITIAGDRLWQLTWTDQTAIERDPETLAERRKVTYPGEGWGLCYDGKRLVMSDGSDRLTFRDPVTFAPSGQVAVHLNGKPVRQLNELECVDGAVWANVYQTDRILRIDPNTGAVTGLVDASGLLTAQQRASADVLNGIAAIPGTNEFLITGKYWPSMFRVRFVPS
ncbi:MAG: glutaminyl-peptide cyclotransferase [Actinomycetota bacterium]|nr:glutaminyl-peptide cyclotransferase [Actinomycetota bacterium]